MFFQRDEYLKKMYERLQRNALGMEALLEEQVSYVVEDFQKEFIITYNDLQVVINEVNSTFQCCFYSS